MKIINILNDMVMTYARIYLLGWYFVALYLSSPNPKILDRWRKTGKVWSSSTKISTYFWFYGRVLSSRSRNLGRSPTFWRNSSILNDLKKVSRILSETWSPTQNVESSLGLKNKTLDFKNYILRWGINGVPSPKVSSTSNSYPTQDLKRR